MNEHKKLPFVAQILQLSDQNEEHVTEFYEKTTIKWAEKMTIRGAVFDITTRGWIDEEWTQGNDLF